MATSITIPAGDTAPDIVTTLRDGAGAIQDLTGATVTLRLRLRGTSTRLNLACTVDNPGTLGVARHVRAAGDNLAKGTYDAEWHVVYASTAVQTFPGEQPNTITVRDPVPAP